MNDKLKLLLLFIIWSLLFFPVYPGLFDAWFGLANSDNSYGILVPFISLYFGWRDKERLKDIVIESSALGLLLLAACLAIYVLSYAGGLVFMQRMMLVSTLIGLVLYILGIQTYRILAFPLLFLFFMVPIPDSIVNIVSFPLQTYATIISSKIIQLFGIPLYREGHMLYFTNTQLEIAEACSGIRSISALLMLSVIFMHQCENSRVKKVIIIFSSVIIAFIANIIRVSGTGILAHFFGAAVARGFLHEFSGLVVFALGFMILFTENKLLNMPWFSGSKQLHHK